MCHPIENLCLSTQFPKPLILSSFAMKAHYIQTVSRLHALYMCSAVSLTGKNK